MSRELHPELFGDEILAHTARDLKIDPFEEIRRKQRSLEDQLQVIAHKVDKLSLVIEQRTTDLKSNYVKLEGALVKTVQEFKLNQDALSERVQNCEMQDTHVPELVQRHNVIIQQFEQRMQAMQKLTSEQEYKLFTYKDTLAEILREIQNLR